MADTDTTLRVVEHSTAEVEWKIQKYFDLPNKIGDYLDSSSFTFSDVEWFLRVYPNGDRLECMGCIGLYLCKRSTPFTFTAFITLAINKVNGSVFKSLDCNTEFEKNVEGVGCDTYLRKRELLYSDDIVAPDGTLEVFCIIKMEGSSNAVSRTSSSPKDVYKFRRQQSVETFSDNFKELFLSGRQGDVTIRVKNKKFVAHRLVLSARSPVFRALFELDLAEGNSGAINIDDCDPDSFEDFLLFLYSGKLDVVSASKALSLYPIAKKYDVQQLKEKCSECLAREISINSVCDVVHLAILHDETELLNVAMKFFIDKGNEIAHTRKWQSFMGEHRTLVDEFLVKLKNKYTK